METVTTRRSLWTWVLIGFFALLFAYDVWEAIGNFLGIQSQALTLRLGVSAFGWVVLVTAILAPVIIFVVALLWSKKLNMARTFFVFVIGLALSAIVSLDVVLGTTAYQIFSVNE